MKARDLIQKLQCLDPEADVWFYFGDNYEFLEKYANFILAKKAEGNLNSSKNGISRNIILKDFCISNDFNFKEKNEFCKMVFTPNFEID